MLPTNPPISIDQICAETGVANTTSLETLASYWGYGLPVSLESWLGKQTGYSVTVGATASQQNYTYASGINGYVGYYYTNHFNLCLIDGGALPLLSSFVYNGTTYNGPFASGSQTVITATNLTGTISIQFNFTHN